MYSTFWITYYNKKLSGVLRWPKNFNFPGCSLKTRTSCVCTGARIYCPFHCRGHPSARSSSPLTCSIIPHPAFYVSRSLSSYMNVRLPRIGEGCVLCVYVFRRSIRSQLSYYPYANNCTKRTGSPRSQWPLPIFSQVEVTQAEVTRWHAYGEIWKCGYNSWLHAHRLTALLQRWREARTAAVVLHANLNTVLKRGACGTRVECNFTC